MRKNQPILTVCIRLLKKGGHPHLDVIHMLMVGFFQLGWIFWIMKLSGRKNQFQPSISLTTL